MFSSLCSRINLMKKKIQKAANSSRLSMSRRPRRLRQSETVRDAVAETGFNFSQLVKPLFVQNQTKKKTEIKAMPGQYRLSLNELLEEVEFSIVEGVKSFALFPVISTALKDAKGSHSTAQNNLAAVSIAKIKKEFPEAVLYADIALDPYTDHGHDGVLKNGIILNDESVEILTQQALLMAASGADFVAPSDMMDGRIGAIRNSLDAQGFANTGILSYTAKYASSFYGPFRDALSSAPKNGDKKTYQMDYRNSREALIEAELDFQEGADILMVKPALAYLDIIQSLKQNFAIPIAAFQVSGEYSMIKFAAAAKVINEEQALLESLYAIKRAGADVIFTYFINDLIKIFKA